MQIQVPSTPFGRRPLSLAMVAGDHVARTCPEGLAVHKWEAFHAICEGRAALGVSERALAVLDALLTFHPETVLTSGSDLVVYPSNVNLALRAHGMPASTLRRHLAVLVEARLVVRRDSPNGKRYVRKGGAGEGDRAFGFDLTPIVARAAEFEAHARAVRDERTATARLRERITIARRNVRKVVEAGEGEMLPGDWAAVRAELAAIAGRLPRLGPSAVLAPLAHELERLAEDAFNLLKRCDVVEETTGNESYCERHYQNSNANFTDSEPAFQEGGAETCEDQPQARAPASGSFPLPLVIRACPDIVDYAKGGISSWRDLVDAAGVARTVLGISPSAWEEACDTLGRDGAAIVTAAILQKGAQVNNAGAYLRSLTAKARVGGFSPGPMLMALLKSHVGHGRCA